MKRVLKWTVPVDDREHLIGSGKVVLVECQHDSTVATVWTEEVGAEPRLRKARAFATGQPLENSWEHVGSCMTPNGVLVWHVFGEKPRVMRSQG